mgnify:CR=1 FL=1
MDEATGSIPVGSTLQKYPHMGVFLKCGTSWPLLENTLKEIDFEETVLKKSIRWRRLRPPPEAAPPRQLSLKYVRARFKINHSIRNRTNRHKHRFRSAYVTF